VTGPTTIATCGRLDIPELVCRLQAAGPEKAADVALRE